MKLVLEAGVIAFAASPIVVGLLNAPAIRAQNSTDWQARAGGKMAFEVASVKPSKGEYVPSNWSLTPWDDYAAATGYFRADASLRGYIEFAYKLWPNDLQTREFAHLPKWVAADRYSIEARAATANPTKDQMRLMVQSLLADRFQLAAHFEAREVPVFELKLARAGQRGPKLIFHADGPPCSSVPTAPDGPTPPEALRDQLGLKLEPAKATLPILIIDRVERPSEN